MNVFNVLVGDWLGVRSPPTKSEILRLVEERLSPTVIKRLCTLGVERKEIDDVVYIVSNSAVSPHPSRETHGGGVRPRPSIDPCPMCY